MSRNIELLNASITTTTAVVLLNLLHQLGIPKERMRMAIDYNRTLKSARYLATKQCPLLSSVPTTGKWNARPLRSLPDPGTSRTRP
jgi:hypothetical protein